MLCCAVLCCARRVVLGGLCCVRCAEWNGMGYVAWTHRRASQLGAHTQESSCVCVPYINIPRGYRVLRCRWAHEIGSPEVVRGLPVKVAVLAGAESAIVGGMTLDYMRRELGQQIPVIALPGCGHHFFLDEPMAFVGVVAAMLAEWARADPARRTSHTNLVGPKEQVETEMREELGEIYGARFVAQRKPAAVKAGAAAAAGGASPLSTPPGSPGSPWGPELPPHASRLTSSVRTTTLNFLAFHLEWAE